MSTCWRPAAHGVSLGPGEAHLWRWPLEAPAQTVAACRRLLDEQELARADRFHFERHRRRFLLARAGLRRLLASYVGSIPEELQFVYGGHGKPSLAGGGVAFNLSHSHELALCVVASEGRWGVDVEHLRPMPDALGIGRRFFSPLEMAALEAAGSACEPLFFRIWTRKEAVLKASGEGLAKALDSFDVAPHQSPACQVETPDGQGVLTKWRVQDIDVGAGYLAAWATDAPPQHCEFFDGRFFA